MRRQAGFFDVDDRLKRLSDLSPKIVRAILVGAASGRRKSEGPPLLLPSVRQIPAEHDEIVLDRRGIGQAPRLGASASTAIDRSRRPAASLRRGVRQAQIRGAAAAPAKRAAG